MFDSIKNKIWELLCEKDVSLALLFSGDGDIIWHRGRRITGKTVYEGTGFSRSYIEEAIRHGGSVDRENVVVGPAADQLSKSAIILRIKSLIILPVGRDFFLYIDSGAKDAFSDTDREVFRVIGSLLGETIDFVRINETTSSGISGTSPQIHHVRELVLRYSLVDDPVLLLGETGVGKTRIAELIHQYSGRKGRLVTVNTPSIPDTLIEREIFGHRRGTFTDAYADRAGLVDEAAYGTLFFDEIAEIPLAFQSKLLRFIDTKRYQVLGEPHEREANVRILAATNRDLPALIGSGSFRQDLYYRLQVLEIQIPPLRERKSDLRELVNGNITLLRGKTIASGFWEALQKHDWKGNVRELITVLIRAGLDAPERIGGAEIDAIIHRNNTPVVHTGSAAEVQKCFQSGDDFWQTAWRPFLEREWNRRELRCFIRDMYHRNGSSIKAMAVAMNIRDADFKKFIAVLHKYRIHPCKPE